MIKKSIEFSEKYHFINYQPFLLLLSAEMDSLTIKFGEQDHEVIQAELSCSFGRILSACQYFHYIIFQFHVFLLLLLLQLFSFSQLFFIFVLHLITLILRFFFHIISFLILLPFFPFSLVFLLDLKFPQLLD